MVQIDLSAHHCMSIVHCPQPMDTLW